MIVTPASCEKTRLHQESSVVKLEFLQPRSYTGLFLHYSSDDIRTHGPAMAQGLTFNYEPRPIIEQVTAPQLWLLGGSDQQAPGTGAQAMQRLELAV
jgi:uncharacterized protein